MKFYFNEDNEVPTCVLCGNERYTEIFYCDDCKEWLCRGTCENKMGLRAQAAVARGLKHLGERFV